MIRFLYNYDFCINDTLHNCDVIHTYLSKESRSSVPRRHAYKVKLSNVARTLSNHHLRARFRFHSNNPASNNNDGTASRERAYLHSATVIGRRRCQGGWCPRTLNTHVSTITPTRFAAPSECETAHCFLTALPCHCPRRSRSFASKPGRDLILECPAANDRVVSRQRLIFSLSVLLFLSFSFSLRARCREVAAPGRSSDAAVPRLLDHPGRRWTSARILRSVSRAGVGAEGEKGSGDGGEGRAD